jgi:hypothetical protein
MGKGSEQRPTDLKKYAANWDAIYGKGPQRQPVKKDPKTWKEFHVELEKIQSDNKR